MIPWVGNKLQNKMKLRNNKVIYGPVGKQDDRLKQPDKPLYEVIINFDDASKQWRQNKIHLGEGIFRYKKTRTR